jgi:hypothetical protein
MGRRSLDFVSSLRVALRDTRHWDFHWIPAAPMAKDSITRPDWLEPGEYLAHCMICNYLLRGLPQMGRCPECGQPYDRRWSLWRDGSRLVMIRSAVLPLRCVKCGDDAADWVRQRVVRKHPAVLLLLLLVCVIHLGGLLLYILVSLITRRTATIHIGLCALHRRRRRNVAIVMGLLLGLAAGMGALGIAYAQPVLGVSMSLSIFLAVGIWLIWGRTVRATHIDRKFVRLAGVCEAVLADLPDFRSPGPVPPANQPIPWATAPKDAPDQDSR